MADSPARSPRSIATRKGDDGRTSLLYGQRVPKNHPQIEVLGALDELNVALGFAKSTRAPTQDIADFDSIQHVLIAIMGELSCAEDDAERYTSSGFARLQETDLARIDQALAAIEARQPKFDGWATPGGNLHAAALELARTTARRAERQIVGLPQHGKSVRPLVLSYVNRVSDLLWLMAREAEA